MLQEQKNAHVPKFGNWENDGDVPYTQYFENAQKEKKGTKLINPNDPLENPDAFYKDKDYPLAKASPSNARHNHRPSRIKNERQMSQEDVNKHQAVNYRSTDALSTQKHAWGSPNWQHNHGNLGDPQRWPSRNNGVDSISHSPLHPHLHIRSASKGGTSSPSSDQRKSSSEKHVLALNTPERAKKKNNGLSDHVLVKGSAVPKFGSWDVMDSSSADGYSYIFDQVREEKQSGSTGIPSSHEPYSKGQTRRINSESTGTCCFIFKK